MFNSLAAALLRRATFAALCLLASGAAGPVPASAQDLPQVVAARVSSTPERARLIIDLDGETTFAVATLLDPNRIVVDVKASGSQIATAPVVAGQGIVTGITMAATDASTVRTELTLGTPAVVQQSYMLDVIGDQPARLVVDLILASDTEFQARAASDLASLLRGSQPGTNAAPESTEPDLPSMADLSVPPPSSFEQPVATNAPASLSKPLIVLDPGHGGVDNGATAPNGDHEKNITLAFTLQLRDLLVKSGRFDVALTRDDDTYLTLNERVTVARQNHADLFISLHADTFQQADIRGASIYTRDERATDILDKVLADGENRADIVAGYAPNNAGPAVVSILVDLMRRQVRQQAFLAATDIVKAMEPGVALRRFPVRQADFFVLQAPDVPSLLIELGFLSNAADIANLEDAGWRQTMIKAIADGIGAYFADLRGTQ